MNEPGRRRILFVDDDSKLLDGLRRMLFPRHKEWDMVFVSSAKEALGALALEPFEVMVTDMRMPGMDGAELLERVVQHYPEIVRLVLSGQWEPEMSFRSAKTAHQYLTKPCNAEMLKATLDRTFLLRGQLNGRWLQRLVSGMTTLPSLPGNYRKLIAVLESLQASIDQVADVIASDIGMSAKVLQLANTAFFGVARRVSRPADAARYLGLETIRALIRRNVFSEFTGPGHAWRTLMATRRKPPAEIGADLCAFPPGLVEDVGIVILINKDPDMYHQVLMLARDENLELDVVEREAFGASRTGVGAYLLWLWGLSDAVTEAENLRAAYGSNPAPYRTAVGSQLGHEINGGAR